MSDFDTILTQLADTYKVDTTKQFFPLNSMRLYYLLLGHGLSGGNQEITDKINQVIPKIAQLLDLREGFLREKGESNPGEEVIACQPAIAGILGVINTPIVQHTLDLLFSDLYPMQEDLLISFVSHLKEDRLGRADLLAMLKIRAMDSVIYSSIVDEIITFKESPVSYQVEPLPLHVNLTMQLNDLVDGICYAQQDMAAGSATLMNIIKKMINTPEELQPTIEDVFVLYQNRMDKLPLPSSGQYLVKEYVKRLTGVVFSAKDES